MAFTNLIGAKSNFVQEVYSSTNYRQSTTATIPIDNTIPQVSEGTAVNIDASNPLIVTITPQRTTNLLLVRGITMTSNAAATYNVFALFRSDSNDAIAVSSITQRNASGKVTPHTVFGITTAGTTSALTISMRFGTSGGTAYLNGSATAANTLGGTFLTSLSVIEIEV